MKPLSQPTHSLLALIVILVAQGLEILDLLQSVLEILVVVLIFKSLERLDQSSGLVRLGWHEIPESGELVLGEALVVSEELSHGGRLGLVLVEGKSVSVLECRLEGTRKNQYLENPELTLCRIFGSCSDVAP